MPAARESLRVALLQMRLPDHSIVTLHSLGLPADLARRLSEVRKSAAGIERVNYLLRQEDERRLRALYANISDRTGQVLAFSFQRGSQAAIISPGAIPVPCLEAVLSFTSVMTVVATFLRCG